MAVTITFSGQIDDVLYELRQLAAAARPGANIHGIGPDTDGGPNPDYVEPSARQPGQTEAEIATLQRALGYPAPKPVEQRVAEAIAALPKRSRRTKAEMEAARAAENPPQPSSDGQTPTPADTEVGTNSASLETAVVGPEVEAETPGEIETVELPETAPAPTFDDLKRALSTVLETDGLGVESGRALVASFGAKKLPDLNAVEWPLFISKANALVAGGAK